MSEHILRPAINLQEIGLNEMSAEEFQRKLYTWFEDRGLLSELRTHLRTQMIGVLRGTAIGRTVSGKMQQSASPKLQALNLIIAEYLLRQQYHYSLSVFTSEVPLINILPEVSNTIVQNAKYNQSIDSKSWRFLPKDTWDVLETIGFLKVSIEGKLIYDMYYEECRDQSLLSCILQMLRQISTVHEKQDAEKHPTPDILSSQSWFKDIYSILVWAKVSEPHLTNISDSIKEIVQKELDTVRDEEKKQQTAIKDEVNETESRLKSEYQKKLAEKQLSFDEALLQITRECQEKHDMIEELAATLRFHQNELYERTNNLHIREQHITEREGDCANKMMLLVEREDELANEIERFKTEKLEISQLKEQLMRSEVKDETDLNLVSKLQEECEKLRQELHVTRNAVTKSVLLNELGRSGVSINDLNANQKEINDLKIDNRNLKQRNAALESKLSDLTSRMQNMSDEWRRSQNEIESMHQILSEAGVEHEVEYIEIRSDPNFQNNFNGGGEEGPQPPVPPAAPFHQNVLRPNVREVSRRRGHRQVIQPPTSSSSEDPSPTEEILHEARERLHKLEEESEMVDKLYREFRERYRRNISSSLLTLHENVTRNEVQPTPELSLQNIYGHPYFHPLSHTTSHLVLQNFPHSYGGGSAFNLNQTEDVPTSSQEMPRDWSRVAQQPTPPLPSDLAPGTSSALNDSVAGPSRQAIFKPNSSTRRNLVQHNTSNFSISSVDTTDSEDSSMAAKKKT